MTGITADAPAEVENATRPEGVLYWTPWAIPFQLDGIARAYLNGQMLAVWDVGLGKSHLAMAASAAAFEDDQVDLVILCCEKTKLFEWVADFTVFTKLRDVLVYHGPKRSKALDGIPEVLVSTYETIRQDVAVFETSRRLRPGKLMEYLNGLRVMVIYDEISKLGNRSSNLYKAHQFMLAQLRKSHRDMRVIGLTATPIERDWENAFNEMRLVRPQAMPTVEGFEELCVSSREPFRPSQGQYGRVKWSREGTARFAVMCAPYMLRKRKTDPDVISQFPSITEEFLKVGMHKDQKHLYQALEDLAWTEGEFSEVPGLRMLMRQFAGHPASLKLAAEHGNSPLAVMAYKAIGPELDACSSAKAEVLWEYLERICGGQDAKALVFTYFGQSVLPILAEQVRRAGHPLWITHGGMSASKQHEAREGFLAHQGGAVLLSSDAGARGVNVPGVSYIIEYEAALTHAGRQQRFGRGSRLGQGVPLTCLTLILEGTMEASSVVRRMMERGGMADVFLGDTEAEEHMSANDRRLLYAMARRRPA